MAPFAENDDHEDAAAFWFARMNSGQTPSEADEIGFRRWLEADPANPAAYHTCEIAWGALALGAEAPEVLAIRAEAAASQQPQRMGRRAFLGLTGGAVAAASGGLWIAIGASPARAVIRTKAGERLTAPLPDGTEVTLAPLTRLRLDYGGGKRRVILEAGQAYFHVASDPARPFMVIVGDQAVVAEGRRFQVTLSADDAPEVVAEEGALRIAPRRDPQTTLARLSPGEAATPAGQAVRVRPVDVEAETGWRLGRLVVHDRPLSEVAAAFNRYSADQLMLGSAARDVRISGSFRYDGGREFAMALASGFDLAVTQQADGWRIDRAPASTATVP